MDLAPVSLFWGGDCKCSVLELHMLSAFGKTGAAVGTQAFTPIQNNLGKRYVSVLTTSLSLIVT